ncbi:hypothetical protein PAPHI01_1961 [Pancytospora philotis]|nr:hypothetical protein PAPHI01_1961 [Pancytospora philotis]
MHFLLLLRTGRAYYDFFVTEPAGFMDIKYYAQQRTEHGGVVSPGRFVDLADSDDAIIQGECDGDCPLKATAKLDDAAESADAVTTGSTKVAYRDRNNADFRRRTLNAAVDKKQRDAYATLQNPLIVAWFRGMRLPITTRIRAAVGRQVNDADIRHHYDETI